MIEPHGGQLVNLVVGRDKARSWRKRQGKMPALSLNPRSLADLEMLASGGFSPLRGFMTKADYRAVMNRMHLANGLAWTIPVVLGVSKEEAASVPVGAPVGLWKGDKMVAVLHVEDKYLADLSREAKAIYRTVDAHHPGVAAIHARGPVLLGGKVDVLEPLHHEDFASYRLSPAQTRRLIAERGWKRVVGFQTRNPIHRAHEYLTKCALEVCDGLLLHPLVGATKADDIPATLRMECYEVLMRHYYPKERVILAVNPSNMYYAGPREAIFHALVRKNFGCTHFIVGRDHAGVGNYYGHYDSQTIFSEFKPGELGIQPLFFENSFYCRRCASMTSNKTCPHPATEHVAISGTRVREMLRLRQLPPVEYSRPEVARLLMG